jgi:glucose/arabinose dehydrogenase
VSPVEYKIVMTLPLFPFVRTLVPGFLVLTGLGAGNQAWGQTATTGDPGRGQTFFQQNCALCHAAAAGVTQQGPSLAGVVGRRAGSGPNFTYTQALKESGLTWDAPTLDKFLAGPGALVPGTTMPVSVADAGDRADVIAYLATLKVPAGASPAAPKVTSTSAAVGTNTGDWQNAAPGVQHHLTVADLPPPYATHSSGNGPKVVPQPAGAALSVPPGFTVKLFASGFSNPRIIRIAPNGDIFIAQTGAGSIRVLRAADGADAPSQDEIFASGLKGPFGIAFYPLGDNPQWVYVANNDSVVRFPYHNGDLQATGPAQVIVPALYDGRGGGHSTRDIAFSLDGKRLFISVGSGSNDAETMSKKSPDEIHQWEAGHGFGAAWDREVNRADILVTDPEGKQPLHTFATGIRNGVGIAVNPETGDLWTSTNERDGLGDDLVPDYITRVKEGGFYGWPWYYMGSTEDPRHKGERPDLAGKILVPDVLLQAHSASLEMTFYTATSGVAAFPAEYRGDVFAAEHGSWNRTIRTGYKIVRARLNHGIPTGEYDDFLTGFVVDNLTVWGRPVGVAVAHDGALLVGEDGKGTLWRIAYTGH